MRDSTVHAPASAVLLGALDGVLLLLIGAFAAEAASARPSVTLTYAAAINLLAGTGLIGTTGLLLVRPERAPTIGIWMFGFGCAGLAGVPGGICALALTGPLAGILASVRGRTSSRPLRRHPTSP